MSDTTEAMRAANPVPNSIALMFILGWQGGTVHQVADALKTNVSDIQNADLERMETLMRQAQQDALASQRVPTKADYEAAMKAKAEVDPAFDYVSGIEAIEWLLAAAPMPDQEA